MGVHYMKGLDENPNDLFDRIVQGRVSDLLIKDKLTDPEKDELSEALRPLNKLPVYKKMSLQMQYKNFRPQYNTKEKTISFLLTIILIALISGLVYTGNIDWLTLY